MMRLENVTLTSWYKQFASALCIFFLTIKGFLFCLVCGLFLRCCSNLQGCSVGQQCWAEEPSGSSWKSRRRLKFDGADNWVHLLSASKNPRLDKGKVQKGADERIYGHTKKVPDASAALKLNSEAEESKAFPLWGKYSIYPLHNDTAWQHYREISN